MLYSLLHRDCEIYAPVSHSPLTSRPSLTSTRPDACSGSPARCRAAGRPEHARGALPARRRACRPGSMTCRVRATGPQPELPPRPPRRRRRVSPCPSERRSIPHAEWRQRVRERSLTRPPRDAAPPSAEVQLKSGGPRAAPTNLNSGEGSESTSQRAVHIVSLVASLTAPTLCVFISLARVALLLRLYYNFVTFIQDWSIKIHSMYIPAAGQKCNVAMCNNFPQD